MITYQSSFPLFLLLCGICGISPKAHMDTQMCTLPETHMSAYKRSNIINTHLHFHISVSFYSHVLSRSLMKTGRGPPHHQQTHSARVTQRPRTHYHKCGRAHFTSNHRRTQSPSTLANDSQQWVILKRAATHSHHHHELQAINIQMGRT